MFKILKYEYFISKKLLPKDFIYPSVYIEFVSQDKPYDMDVEPWHFFCSHLDYRFEGLKKRYPDKILIPFARRGDNDDVACFDGSQKSDDPKVLIIHDFATNGWENRGECENFPAWLKMAEAESLEWKQYMLSKRHG
ncbi:MAG TPA: SMI1/KNR4 family protein [Gammaproteobacteria bacterium]|nr:SMI1/KNR4 family protein [Gammaproteobacteria bacterium]